MNIIKKAAIGAIASILLPVAAMAEGNLHAGPLEFHPFLQLREAYSNNIYTTPNLKKPDWYTNTVAGLRLDLPFREHRAQAGYSAEFRRYAKYDSENTTDHHANGLLDFKFGRRLGLTLTDVYAKGHEGRGESSTGFIERYETNAAAASASYALADISKVQLDYTRISWDYKESGFRNRNEDLVSAYIYLRFLPKTSGFIEYDHKYIDYNANNSNLNSMEDSGSLGLKWEATETSTGTVKAGFVQKNFSNTANKDFKTWTASADVNHEFTDFSGFSLGAYRMVNETTLTGNRYIVSTGGNLELRHKFFTKFTGIVTAAIANDRFSDTQSGVGPVRKDTTVSGGAGLKYAMRDWLNAGLDYTHKDKNSNNNASDYEENIYGVNINFEL
ncbi:MAG: outer membrane beta-barrel protein [Deltaproteobacteria bacterium]|nr:outer membrane beta-barrel protein [Deltaproteobacteria bacterium]